MKHRFPPKDESGKDQCVHCGSTFQADVFQDSEGNPTCAKHSFEMRNAYYNCGDCGVVLTARNMWSEYTCKKCANKLELIK